MKIQLVLTDDWELRGDGSGDMKRLQFQPICQLSSIYDKFGFKGSFFVEVQQQLKHLALGNRHPNLAELARQWEEVVREIFSRGHDIQLHVHPQWSYADYINSQWRLGHKWSLLEYPSNEIEEMLTESKAYLENLLRPVRTEYECNSFRASKWCLAPDSSILTILSNLGIVVDTSIVPGIMWTSKAAHFDYEKVDEPFLPYFPQMTDARRISSKKESIICVPTHTFIYGKKSILIRVARKAFSFSKFDLHRHLKTPNKPRLLSGNRALNGSHPSELSRYRRLNLKHSWHKFVDLLSTLRTPVYVISDLSALSSIEMNMMLRDIRKKAQNVTWPIVPVIITNHTKNIINFEPIEKFCEHIADSTDVEVITCTRLARDLRAGVYPIVKKTNQSS